MSQYIDAQWLSALTALVAVVLSPIISIYVARRQIKASVVSSNRQKWIDQLRDRLSELITGIRFLNLRQRSKNISEKEFVDKFNELFLLETRINLLLNPNEGDHKELSGKIRGAIERIFEEKDSDEPHVVKLTDEVMNLSQGILKREWERVKRGN
jgi:ABC-type multidrug transport system fused ATPase/permease subunit